MYKAFSKPTQLKSWLVSCSYNGCCVLVCIMNLNDNIFVKYTCIFILVGEKPSYMKVIGLVYTNWTFITEVSHEFGS